MPFRRSAGRNKLLTWYLERGYFTNACNYREAGQLPTLGYVPVQHTCRYIFEALTRALATITHHNNNFWCYLKIVFICCILWWTKTPMGWALYPWPFGEEVTKKLSENSVPNFLIIFLGRYPQRNGEIWPTIWAEKALISTYILSCNLKGLYPFNLEIDCQPGSLAPPELPATCHSLARPFLVPEIVPELLARSLRAFPAETAPGTHRRPFLILKIIQKKYLGIIDIYIMGKLISWYKNLMPLSHLGKIFLIYFYSDRTLARRCWYFFHWVTCQCLPEVIVFPKLFHTGFLKQHFLGNS